MTQKKSKTKEVQIKPKLIIYTFKKSVLCEGFVKGIEAHPVADKYQIKVVDLFLSKNQAVGRELGITSVPAFRVEFGDEHYTQTTAISLKNALVKLNACILYGGVPDFS